MQSQQIVLLMWYNIISTSLCWLKAFQGLQSGKKYCSRERNQGAVFFSKFCHGKEA